MAMAATVCVASPSSSLSAARASSRECRTRGSCRVQIAAASSSAGVSSIGRLSSRRRPTRECRWQAVAEQLQAAAAATEEVSEEAGFPSDALYIFFEAEGSLPESAVVKLTTALEGVEGVSNVEITATPDGTSTVKLTKQMSVQQTEVASGLVDVLLKGGFKLQAVNLGFDEEGGDDDDLYDYDIAAATEESEATE